MYLMFDDYDFSCAQSSELKWWIFLIRELQEEQLKTKVKKHSSWTNKWENNNINKRDTLKNRMFEEIRACTIEWIKLVLVNACNESLRLLSE